MNYLSIPRNNSHILCLTQTIIAIAESSVPLVSKGAKVSVFDGCDVSQTIWRPEFVSHNKSAINDPKQSSPEP